MANTDQDLRELLNRPRESLGVELKRWVDPATPAGKAKIAKGCIALRNNDGGVLLIGFKDDGTPDMGNAPTDVAASFHSNVVQAIVSKYSSEIFALDVVVVEELGQKYPVITVPPGVRTPVAAKADLKGDDGKALIREHAVYVRSLTSNNTFSSSEARRGDWENLTRICFNNREADIGGFIRRHLAALDLQSLAALVPAFAPMVHTPTNAERIVEELNQGRNRYDIARQRRKLAVPDIGYRESAVVVDGELPQQPASAEFRDRLLRNAPRHTGWTPFVELTSDRRQDDHPHVIDEGWQALVANLPREQPIIGHSLDFWRIETPGVFYHLRGLEDDLNQLPNVQPRQQLDFLLQISRTAEVISTALSFARSMGCKDNASLIFGFRWTKLEGRALTCWVDPRWYRFNRQQLLAHQPEYTTPPIVVPLETPPTGIGPHVENAVRGLFVLFGGTQIPSDDIESIVNDTLFRRR